MYKRTLLLIITFIFVFTIGISTVLADCSDCNTSNCESCGCVLNSEKTACVYSNYKDDTTSCGNGMLTDIPRSVPKIISIVYILIQIAVPIVLVILGSLDLFKGITAQKEDEIKKGQQMFVKRLLAAGSIFFVFSLVKIIISLAADEKDNSERSGKNIINCAECFIQNKCNRK